MANFLGYTSMFSFGAFFMISLWLIIGIRMSEKQSLAEFLLAGIISAIPFSIALYTLILSISIA